MKLYKLYIHQKSFHSEELLLNPKDHPGIKKGDVVEIYHPDDEGCRLLLQVTCLMEDLKTARDSVSVESNIAQLFNLRTYADVYIKLVDPVTVALDSVEITFKDQYMGRSEMWRLKQHLTQTAVYVNKKIEYCEGSIRCQVYEMWCQGDRVACGVINEDTKVVFRSSTSMVYLFIQMSSEMWDFDIHGDLYFEKAVNGFLTDLFLKWKKLGSNHEVTIVLFSRTFYSAKSLEEFPVYMRDCLQKDYKGRFYEDFYRVAVQNERNDDWATILVQLRRLFSAYEKTVLKFHEKPGIKVPPANNSTAAQGNFLEVLNISLNVFEKHYLDRSFDRTGQLSVVITPGVGVFEVDRELTNITKQRIIDNGVGSDLVCVGEQPLHAVPLLKFHCKDSSFTSVDDYSMPHWLNLSFYSTNKKVAYSTFIPRIKLPPLIRKHESEDELEPKKKAVDQKKQKINFYADNHTEYIHNSLFDYDAYDAQIFTLPHQGTCSLQRVPRTKKTSVPCMEAYGNYSTSVSSTKDWDASFRTLRRKMSDPDIHYSAVNIFSNISENNSPTQNETTSQSVLTPSKQKRAISTVAPVIRAGRALINPFDPSHVTIKLTSNRRRWSHIFPKGPSGVLIQQHHYQAVPTTTANNHSPNYGDNMSVNSSTSFFNVNNSDDYQHSASCHFGKPLFQNHKIDRSDDEFNRLSVNNTPTERNSFLNDSILSKRKVSVLHSAAGASVAVAPSKSMTLLWGATGEQEWTPALTTGVDWKSLTIPACLPITTDYFPDKRSLNNDYVVSDYTLLPDDVNADFMRNRAVYKKPLSTEEVFKELVSQRLAQGFQLIVMPDPQQNPPNAPCCGGKLQPKLTILPAPVDVETMRECLLSIGRIFHKITLTGSEIQEIKVTRYRPRHPYPPINVDYRYRFVAPQHDTYEVSGVNFTTEKLENFNWNKMDQYVCTRGDTDFELQESMKYWRYRMYLLPKDDPYMRKIIDGNLQRCDIYPGEITSVVQKQQIEEFLRFVETHLNKIKRVVIKKPRASPTTQQSHLTRRRHSYSTSILSRPPAVNQALQNSPFRERVGSNRLPEKFRPRSGSKVESRSTLAQLQASLAEKKNADDPNAVNEDTDDSFLPEPPKFKMSTPLEEIFEAFKHPTNGVGYLVAAPSLPSLTFVSYDAIIWLSNHIEENVNPFDLLEAMRDNHWICHASGDFSMRLISGFYLYYIAQQDKESPDYSPPLGDLEAFENEWMQVEIPLDYICMEKSAFPTMSPPSVSGSQKIMEKDVPLFLRDDLKKRNLDGKLYKQSHLEVDLSNKSDRVEFGHARYHAQFVPGNAFEIVVQWISASGPIVYDLIYGWSRKSQQCGYQLMPISCDPLAEPFVDKSDPLRGPIFIPLNIECLKQNRTNLFDEFKKETWPERILLFQDAIVKRFGFISGNCETKTGSNEISIDSQYVHVTGNMFILVPSPCHGLRSTLRRLGISNNGSGSYSNSSSSSGSLQSHKKLCNYYQQQQQQGHQKENYITRHVNGNLGNNQNGGSPCKESEVQKLGSFLWQWNHMIQNKKWKSLIINQSDEIFQLRMLRDFTEFCANRDGRLLKFWDECWELKEKLSIINNGGVV